ncbi:uncharacterized protein LOC130743658 [Lotus japonicus]|uniref:uncharacterized protein LOC130743658 n=1 Tax=Lotus japonicus TaxID=34305 RepID=UPI002584E244|nr:uncharacterized protein LOC130743658 [Lotus japonicus]
MHGPCGKANPTCACMKNGKCTKYFPKKFQNSTTIDDNGYPHYRRRQSGIKVLKNGIELDSRNVVPYNPKLLMRYHAHINVEYCNKSNSIKYLFKYVNKGSDRVTAEITTTAESSGNKRVVDEIEQYYDCRYLSPCEAVWRTFKFEIHERWPPVKGLKFHLENQQSVLFGDHEDITDVLDKKGLYHNVFGVDLTYSEFPSKFVYNEKFIIWELRKQGYSIRRLTYIPPGTGELYYMRMLLAVQRGCISFESIRTVKGEIHSTYQKACYALGLLSDDKQYIGAIREASELGSDFTCFSNYDLSGVEHYQNKFGVDEMTYNSEEMQDMHANLVSSLTDEQRKVSKGSLKAKLLQQSSLIIWDEAPMLNIFCFEALDRTLKDIMSSENRANANKPFGGKVVVLGGDFKQILHVIQKGSRQDIVTATILKLGNGESTPNDDGKMLIDVPHDIFITDPSEPLLQLIQFFYPDMVSHLTDPTFYQERAILALTLESVEKVNQYILSCIEGEEKNI